MIEIVRQPTWRWKCWLFVSLWSGTGIECGSRGLGWSPTSCVAARWPCWSTRFHHSVECKDGDWLNVGKPCQCLPLRCSSCCTLSAAVDRWSCQRARTRACTTNSWPILWDRSCRWRASAGATRDELQYRSSCIWRQRELWNQTDLPGDGRHKNKQICQFIKSSQIVPKSDCKWTGRGWTLSLWQLIITIFLAALHNSIIIWSLNINLQTQVESSENKSTKKNRIKLARICLPSREPSETDLQKCCRIFVCSVHSI